MKSQDKHSFAWFCRKMNVWVSIEIHTLQLHWVLMHILLVQQWGRSREVWKVQKVWTVRNAIQEINLYAWGSSIAGYRLIGRAKWGRFGEVWIIQKFKICTRLSRRRATEERGGNLYVSRAILFWMPAINKAIYFVLFFNDPDVNIF